MVSATDNGNCITVGNETVVAIGISPTFAMGGNRVLVAEATAMWRNTATGASGCRRRMVSGKRIGGVISVVGAPQNLFDQSDAGVSGAVVGFQVASGQLQVIVTGIAATNLQWDVQLSVLVTE